MEDIVLLVLQFLGELLLQFVAAIAYAVAEVIFEAVAEKGAVWTGKGISALLSQRWFLYLLGLACGGAAGWASLLIYPHSFLRDPALRIANLAVSPLATAYLCRMIAAARGRGCSEVDPDFHFWMSLWFSLGFAVARFGFAVR